MCQTAINLRDQQLIDQAHWHSLVSIIIVNHPWHQHSRVSIILVCFPFHYLSVICLQGVSVSASKELFSSFTLLICCLIMLVSTELIFMLQFCCSLHQVRPFKHYLLKILGLLIPAVQVLYLNHNFAEKKYSIVLFYFFAFKIIPNFHKELFGPINMHLTTCISTICVNMHKYANPMQAVYCQYALYANSKQQYIICKQYAKNWLKKMQKYAVEIRHINAFNMQSTCKCMLLICTCKPCIWRCVVLCTANASIMYTICLNMFRYANSMQSIWMIKSHVKL